MNRILVLWIIVSFALPFSALAVINTSNIWSIKSKNTDSTQTWRTLPNTLNYLKKRKVVSGERIIPSIPTDIKSTATGSSGSGNSRNLGTLANRNALKEAARPKSQLETAVERQKQREADLEKQKKEQREEEDRKRALVAAWEAKKKAEEDERRALLQQRQPNETIASYCARADNQWFLKTVLKYNSVQECIDKITSRTKILRKVVSRSTSNKRDTTSSTLRRLCNEEYAKTGNIPTFCEGYVTRTGSGGTTGTGRTLTTR